MGNNYQVTTFPDVPSIPGVDEEDAYAAMVEAARARGGLAPGEDLVALPSGSQWDSQGWTKEGSVTSPAGKQYDIYTRLPADSPVELSAQPEADSDAQEALEDIDNNFAGDSAPGSSITECAAGFAKGFVQGAVIGYATGFVLGFLGPAGVVIGVGLLLYSAYEIVTNWNEIQALPPEQKAELVGGIFGGLLGGIAGAKGGRRFSAGLKKPPKTKANINSRQKIHKPGTNEYKTRSASPKGKPTAWKNAAEADDVTLEAYEKGTVTERFPDGSPKEVKWNAGRPVGENGETQVTVKLNQKGELHGFPSGKGNP